MTGAFPIAKAVGGCGMHAGGEVPPSWMMNRRQAEEERE
jgi:hypothetical protein